ncbi:uncharacterized protein MELLADRAFT_107622 [Melampsora larici-populina 98AG31]|uniref:Uncharacterized protein n=1 Tax=Melampsora larici-populina (strain 98AG31 / pathotype 3-4-7) TaxID=747676 RepID=F4RQ84_MELLP|nr:uncharacterized protein MELLADRAFT_107622 [Melampsora larici-populina 98AG31]EGG05449.1 hypothetical protein MELLADRAFT_107622 [Melampsora larici-populina 98AG31]
MTQMKVYGILFSVLQAMGSLLNQASIFESGSRPRSKTRHHRWKMLLLLIAISMSITVQGSMLDFLKPATRKISDLSRNKGSTTEKARPMIGHHTTREFKHEKNGHLVSPQESGIKHIGQLDQKEWKLAESQHEISPQASTPRNRASRPPRHPKKFQQSWPLPLSTEADETKRPTQHPDLRDTSRTLNGKHRPIDESTGAEIRALETPQDPDFSFPIWHSEKEQGTSDPTFRFSNTQKAKGYWEYPKPSN